MLLARHISSSKGTSTLRHARDTSNHSYPQCLPSLLPALSQLFQARFEVLCKALSRGCIRFLCLPCQSLLPMHVLSAAM